MLEDDTAAEIAAAQVDDWAKSFEPAIVENNFFQCNWRNSILGIQQSKATDQVQNMQTLKCHNCIWISFPYISYQDLLLCAFNTKTMGFGMMLI